MYLPGSQTSFAASPCASLGEDCPTGTAFLGQVVMDRTPSPVGTDKKRKRAAEGEEQKTWLEDKEENTAVWRLNLLLFDILKYGVEIDFRTSKVCSVFQNTDSVCQLLLISGSCSWDRNRLPSATASSTSWMPALAA